MDAGEIVIKTDVDNEGAEQGLNDLESQIYDLAGVYEDLVKEYEELTKHKKGDMIFEDDVKRAEQIKLEMKEIAKEFEQITGQKISIVGVDDLEPKLKGMRLNVKGIVGDLKRGLTSIVRWGLALFGITGVLSMIRSAMSTITSQDEQLGADLTYMKNVIAYMLEPVVRRIIELFKELMYYVGYIAKMWFGVNIYADASSKAMKAMEKSSGATAKNAKEIKKQLAGFDEMNVLSDTSSSGGGGGGVTTPSFDLSDLDNMKMPKWVDWIAKNKDKVLDFLKIAGAILAGIKIAQIVSGFSNLFRIFKDMGSLQTFGIIAGFAITLVGILRTIEGINKFVESPSLGALNDTLNGIGITLAGIGVTLVALNFSNPIGWIILLTGAIVAMETSIVDSIISNQKYIDSIYDVATQEEELIQAKERRKKAQDDLIDAVDRQAIAEENLIKVQNETGESGEQLWTSVENGTLTYDKMTKQQRETYKAYRDLIGANKDLKSAQDELKDSSSKVRKEEFDVQIANDKTGKSYNDLRDQIIDAWKKGEIETEDASDSISMMMGKMDTKAYNVFTKNIPTEIKDGLKPENYVSNFNKFKAVWNNWIDSLKRKIGLEFDVNGGGSGKGFAKGGVVVALAGGGIINQPGRGVPLGSAIGGEAGREGVIPLTDSQQMALLGEAIGKYITVQNVNPIYLNGRQIAREVNISNNESDFAFNR